MIPYTKLKEHNRHNLANAIPLEKPFTLIIEPSSKCNFRCLHCFQSIKDKNYFTDNRMNMSMELFSRVIDEMKKWDGAKLKVLKLSLYGEPLLNPLFCEMLKMAKEAEIAERIETTTNASLLTEEICEKIICYGLDYMRVSIYSPIQDKHVRITGSKMNIGTIHDNLSKLQSKKKLYTKKTPFVSVKMLDTYSAENAIFQHMYQDVADEIYFDEPHNWIPYKEKDFIKDLYGHENRNSIRNNMGCSSTKRIACTLPFFTLAVRSNGDVSPCCNDWIGGTNIGNINKENLREIWNGEAVYEFQKMQLENRKKENSSCRKCRIYLSDHYIKDNIDGFPVAKLRGKNK